MARVVDLHTAVDVLGGKVEFEAGEEGREEAILTHLLRTVVAQTARDRLGGVDLGPLVLASEAGESVTTGDHVSATELLAGVPDLGEVTTYDSIAERLGANGDGARAAAVELALEGLYLAKRIGKETDGPDTVYGV